MDMNKLVDVKNISFSYDKDSPAVFENISFSIEKGDVLCVLGPNGTGKTTLIKCINGLHKVNEGEVYLNGANIQKTVIIEKNVTNAQDLKVIIMN